MYLCRYSKVSLSKYVAVCKYFMFWRPLRLDEPVSHLNLRRFLGNDLALRSPRDDARPNPTKILAKKALEPWLKFEFKQIQKRISRQMSIVPYVGSGTFTLAVAFSYHAIRLPDDNLPGGSTVKREVCCT